MLTRRRVFEESDRALEKTLREKEEAAEQREKRLEESRRKEEKDAEKREKRLQFRIALVGTGLAFIGTGSDRQHYFFPN